MAEANGASPKQNYTYQIEAKNLQNGLAKMWNNTCLFDIKVSFIPFHRFNLSEICDFSFPFFFFFFLDKINIGIYE